MLNLLGARLDDLLLPWWFDLQLQHSVDNPGLLENIERVLERGDKIELLVESTARLQSDAAAFRSTTRRVARRMWWNNAKMFFLAWCVCVFVLYLIGAQFCGWNLYLCSSKHRGGTHASG